MHKYFYDQNGSQAGPVAADQLLDQGITATTLVWRDGMPEWAVAATIPELSNLFRASPPPLPPLPVSAVPPLAATPFEANQASTSPALPHQETASIARPQFSAKVSTRKWWHYLIYIIAIIFIMLFFRACGAVIGHVISAAPAALPPTEYKGVAHTHGYRLPLAAHIA